MKILLPPSETKAPGGSGPALDLASLVWPELQPHRERVARQLVDLSSDPATAMKTLGLGVRLAGEVSVNAALRAAPTMPAIERYTGVLFDALDVRTLSAASRRRLDASVMVGSALFGMVAAHDWIPAYRLSGSVKLPGIGALQQVWKPELGPLLTRMVSRELVIDLRSGIYQKLAPAPEAVQVRVLSERADGSRSVVSHANKHTKGCVARALVRASRACRSVEDVVRTLEAADMHVEMPSAYNIDVILAM